MILVSNSYVDLAFIFTPWICSILKYMLKMRSYEIIYLKVVPVIISHWFKKGPGAPCAPSLLLKQCYKGGGAVDCIHRKTSLV